LNKELVIKVALLLSLRKATVNPSKICNRKMSNLEKELADEMLYRVIAEAIEIWRSENSDEQYLDKQEVIDIASEMLDSEFAKTIRNEVIAHTDYAKHMQGLTKRIATKVWENEEEYFV
tara:strand:+ start:1828 stop:2184 length:357 start_codon:yes stop_codon:yes gene_type:complete